jgi:hypothetical protein
MSTLWLVELTGFEPLTSCMPCHPHHLTQHSAAMPSTRSALLRRVDARGAVVRHKATHGTAADNLLTGRDTWRRANPVGLDWVSRLA